MQVKLASMPQMMSMPNNVFNPLAQSFEEIPDEGEWFIDSRLKYKNNPAYDGDFVFQSERINNSPYVMIKDKEGIEIVREGLVQEQGFNRNRVGSFSKSLKRPSFVKSMGTSINENRFALNDLYDKSSYLTKVTRPKAMVNFDKPSKRDSILIAKGGDDRIDLGGKSQVMTKGHE